MLTAITFSLLGATNPITCPLNSVCSTATGISGRVEAQITLSMTLMSSENLSLNSVLLDDEINAYRLAVNTLTTSEEDAASIDYKYLVIDNRIYGDPDTLLFTMVGNELEVNIPDTFIVMEDNPTNERLVREMLYQGKSELLAMAHQ